MTRNYNRNSLILKLLFLSGVVAALVITWFLFSYRTFSDVVAKDMSRSCSPVIGLPGTEDMALDPKTGRVFISSMDRRALEQEGNARGRIALFDPADPLSTSWRDRTSGIPAAFQPLGLGFYEGEGVKRLFVINEKPAAVLLYNVSDAGDLTFIREFKDQRLNSPNSVVAVGPTSFYVTNDVAAGRDSLFGKLQFFLKLKTGSIFYFDGKSWSVTTRGLGFANGIEKSPDGKYIYVAETTAGQISTFERDIISGHLTLMDRVKVNSFPDNLSLRADGSLLYAAHPRPLVLPTHLSDPETLAPSEFGAIKLGAGTSGPSTSLWVNDGATLSGSTVAVEVGRKLLIGALYEDKFLLCD